MCHIAPEEGHCTRLPLPPLLAFLDGLLQFYSPLNIIFLPY